VAAFGARRLELQRTAQVVLGLDVGGEQLQVQRAQEARGLAQDRDAAGRRRELGDPRRGGLREQVGENM
jgi:hypothetical protein